MGIWGLIGVYIGIDVGSTKDVAKNWNLGGDSACKKRQMVNKKCIRMVMYHIFFKYVVNKSGALTGEQVLCQPK